MIAASPEISTTRRPKVNGRAATKPRPKSKRRRARHHDRAATVVALVAASTTVIFSMILNVAAFTSEGDGWFGISLGIALPLWVLAATFVGHHLHIDRRLACGAYALAGFMLLVSLPHLAHGYEALGLAWWEGWSLAIVTDLTQVVMKMAIIRMWTR
jgi:hypothetical protein